MTADVDHRGTTLLECIQLLHEALPELDHDTLDLSTQMLGRRLRAPLMITGMTGGAEFAGALNRGLAEAAGRCGIALGVGSQRVMLRHPDVAGDFAVRKYMPDGLLLGNIGAVQLREYSLRQIEDLVERIEADGLCVHLNPGQELIQAGGDRDFRGLCDQIARLVDRLGERVIVKETGAGLGPRTLAALKRAGVSAVDIAGAGGTSWTKVEMLCAEEPSRRQLGESLMDWGLPTAFGVMAARQILGAGSGVRVIASGGIRSGLDAARAIAAGADLAGMARPVLMAFRAGGTEAVECLLNQTADELRAAMLLTGSPNLGALREAPRVYTGELRHWLEVQGWLEHRPGDGRRPC